MDIGIFIVVYTLKSRTMTGERVIVTEHKIGSLIIAGHSHIGSLFGGTTEKDILLLPVEGQDRIFGLHGPWPRTENYWSALTQYAPGNSIALLWGGNEHNGIFLIEQPPRFDFVPRRLPSLPVEEDATIVPEALVRVKLQYFLGPLHDLLAVLKERTECRIVVVGTPPPKGDNEHIRRLLAPDFAYLQHAAGATVNQVTLTSPSVRLKLWHVLQENYKEQAERDGAEFLPVRHIGTDEAGFLKPEFWAPDATHANRAYGRLVLDYLADKLLGCPKVRSAEEIDE